MNSLVVPFYFGQGVQVGPGWGREVTSIRVPAGLARCSGFLREHSARGEVVQNSEDDRWIILGALAERPVYVADTWRGKAQTNEKIIRRLDEMASFRRLTDPAEIAAFAARRQIAWYVLDPATRVKWPASILDHPAFEIGRVPRLSVRAGSMTDARLEERAYALRLGSPGMTPATRPSRRMRPRPTLLDEQHLLIRRQRPEVVGDDGLRACRRRSGRRSWRG